MQLAVGMTLFFALGALGGSMSMLMQVGGTHGSVPRQVSG
jgi:hypothetical protein